ncbi:hypothetical protein NDU88_007269 [Pleurodeles waltl]|uniref:Uncharacterized protein n=1 Tax=Pleurodeles waltl TaxID=8319 RepID=A0AAV7P0D8_PLEWA|nr:hypothetical protein NDU88_007269 [Pleurodeles waltl]
MVGQLGEVFQVMEEVQGAQELQGHIHRVTEHRLHHCPEGVDGGTMQQDMNNITGCIVAPSTDRVGQQPCSLKLCQGPVPALKGLEETELHPGFLDSLA